MFDLSNSVWNKTDSVWIWNGFLLGHSHNQLIRRFWQTFSHLSFIPGCMTINKTPNPAGLLVQHPRPDALIPRILEV
jgi:hypothetical protein